MFCPCFFLLSNHMLCAGGTATIIIVVIKQRTHHNRNGHVKPCIIATPRFGSDAYRNWCLWCTWNLFCCPYNKLEIEMTPLCTLLVIIFWSRGSIYAICNRLNRLLSMDSMHSMMLIYKQWYIRRLWDYVQMSKCMGLCLNYVIESLSGGEMRRL